MDTPLISKPKEELPSHVSSQLLNTPKETSVERDKPSVSPRSKTRILAFVFLFLVSSASFAYIYCSVCQKTSKAQNKHHKTTRFSPNADKHGTGVIYKKPFYTKLKIPTGNDLPKVDRSASYNLNRLFSQSSSPVDSKQAFGSNGAVAADNAHCSQIGVDALKDGGSAVDAAISTAICIGLFNSFSSGIGGGGFMVIRLPNGQSEFIDFREVAPLLAEPLMFKDNITLAQVGGLAVGVPGELRGYELAHKRHGRLSWSRLLEPTIKLARDGYSISKILAFVLEREHKSISSADGFKDVFLRPDGSPLREGDIGKRVNFANTLQKIADKGSQVFYEGEIAQSIVSYIKKNNGIISLDDLKAYTPVIRETASFTYHGRKIITGAPPTSGTIVGHILNILEEYNLKADDPILSAHRIVEAFKFGFSQRTHLGDPDFVQIKKFIELQQSKEYAEVVRKNITDDRTHSWKYYNPEFDIKDDHGTTHLSVVDKDGMAVSLTSTINLLFGSKLMDPVTGVVLNNHMDDFSTPNIRNAFGLYPSPNNFILPKKRPLSTTSAMVIEKDGKVEYVLGASGGSKILTSTLQVLLNSIDFGKSLKQAIDAPRMHHQLLPNQLLLEPHFPSSIRQGLSKKGHKIDELGLGLCVVQGVHVLDDGTINAVSDGRKFGAPAAY
ncbi:hypothetical protein BB560_001893 [Smittium megazygosporum]|uniref:Glutathione hydrolase n=1 Tax=Smittium megazygosporum TaxID=133381 RepID=A0A2T9ZGA3_9FUNG|nr:hypothetical protein BB560_001893 [Smittium megazygosporum]